MIQAEQESHTKAGKVPQMPMFTFGPVDAVGRQIIQVTAPIIMRDFIQEATSVAQQEDPK
jgi:hypothetical protein